jgi:hypothetical protein
MMEVEAARGIAMTYWKKTCPVNSAQRHPLLALGRSLHRDEGGAISIIAVFAVLLLTMLLGMVMNVGRHVDGKIRMQNAADATAYSGGLTIARGMNTLAFSNHLLAEVFAITAFMREARDANSAQYVPRILQAWNVVSESFRRSGFPKFEALGRAIPQKTPLEQNLVNAYTLWGAAVSQRTLPLMEAILDQRLIPDFERAVVATYPDIAQAAASEVARANGRPDHGRGQMLGVLWRTDIQPVGGMSELSYSTLPVADPNPESPQPAAQYAALAREQRDELARHYLNDWNYHTLLFFDREAKMGQFAALWRSFTCGYLQHLLNTEFPNTNLPMVICSAKTEGLEPRQYLDRHFGFLGLAYWKKLPALFPGLFIDPTANDSVTFAEVRVFVPKRRLVWVNLIGGSAPTPMGGMPGDLPNLPSTSPPPTSSGGGRWVVGFQGVPQSWDLLNQHWTVQLVPATQSCLAAVLQTQPPLPQFGSGDYHLPNLGGLSSEDIVRVSPH